MVGADWFAEGHLNANVHMIQNSSFHFGRPWGPYSTPGFQTKLISKRGTPQSTIVRALSDDLTLVLYLAFPSIPKVYRISVKGMVGLFFSNIHERKSAFVAFVVSFGS